MSGVSCILMGSGDGLPGEVSMPDTSPDAYAVGFTATASLRLSGGSYTSTGQAGGGYCNPLSVNSSLEARLTVQSGSNPTGSALSTWLALTTDRTWSISRGSVGLNSSVCLLELRDAVSGIVRDTATISFTAQVDI